MFSKLLYIVFDSVAGAMSGPLMVYPSDAVAIRDFADAVRADGSRLARHADDFSLVCVGHVSDSGDVEGLEKRTVITARNILDISEREVLTNE